MRKAMLILGILCMCAQGAKAGEPFEMPVATEPSWLTELRWAMQVTYRAEILRIVAVSAGKDVGVINREVQLSPVIATDNNCAAKAAAKCAVARLLGYDCRIVFGGTRAGEKPGHVMASIPVRHEWYMLDNKHVVADYDTPTDTEVASGKNIRIFYPRYVLKY